MKIAIIAAPLKIPPNNYGGTERTIYILAKTLAEKGHDITVFAGPGSKIPGCKIKSFVHGYSLDQNWFKQKLYSITHMIKCYLYINKEFDIIHNNVWEEGIALSFLAKIPVLTNIHGIAHERLILKLITKICSLSRKTKIMTISKRALELNKKFYGDDVIGYVHQPINITQGLEFSDCPNKKHKIELCFVGILAPWKGPDVAIQVSDRLHEQGFDVRLRIAGKLFTKDKKYTKRIQSLIKNKSYVEFLGELNGEKLGQLYKNSDSLLFPIKWEEPFGLVTIESMFCGTPVIAFPKGSVPEIIKNNFNGFICKTTEEMCKAVLLINNIKRKDCHDFVTKNFNADKISDEYLNLYKMIFLKGRKI